jgi:hypothetical protein
MQPFRAIRAFCHNLRHGWLSVTVFYLVLTSLSYAAYHYLSALPAAQGVANASQLWAMHGNPLTGVARVWLIFAWGFGLQSLVQIWRVIRRRPRDASLTQLFKHGAWLSAHAGLFEEIIFRLYAFLSFIILLRLANEWAGGWL